MQCPSCGNENREGARFCDSCGSELTAEPAASADIRQEPLAADVPTEIAGRYRVKRFLGQGGRKRVYLSDDTATGTEVAVALFDTAGVGAAIQARARREAEAMRKLGDHPHVVTVLDTAVLMEVELPGVLGMIAGGLKDRLQKVGHLLLTKS